MPSLGARLRLEREQRGITLDQISRATKIGTRFLRALEQDHYEQLPGGIFNKGFIRAYARFLGLNEEEAVAEYLAATSPEELSPEVPELGAQPQVKSERAGSLPWGTFALLLLVVALSFAIWGSYKREPGTQVKQSVASTPNSRGSTAVPASSASLDSRTPAAEHLASPSDKSGEVAPQPPPAGQRAPADSPGPTGAGASPQSPPSKSPVSPASLVTASFVVRIKAHQNARVAITADGTKLREETLMGGSEKSVRASNQVIIKTGNPGALDFEFNGQKLPNQGTDGEAKTLEFGPNGLEVTISSPR